MISVVIPTLDAEAGLPATLAALVPAAVDGLVREVIVADGGSRDGTVTLAEAAGAEVWRMDPSRGEQLATGAARARFSWLLFLHADTVLEPGWEREAWSFIEQVEGGHRGSSAAAFRFALDDVGLKPRLVEAGVALRCGLLRLPYGDQGLLIPKALYHQVGGFRPMPLFEDVDLVRRLGRRRIVMLRARARTSAARYRRDGYFRRVASNLACVIMFYLGLPVDTLARLCR
jgi:rSAM/selenodomain-associated transferase 2